MKKLIVLVALCLAPYIVGAETVTWSNPTQYTDGSTIPAAKQAQLSTDIQYRTGTTFTNFGTATGGATTFNAPYVTSSGATSYWRLRSISVGDNNSTSAWSAEVAFTRPFQVPAAPTPASVQ